MQVRGPHTTLFPFGAADGAEIRGEGVEPDVEDVRLFAGNGNAPADGGAGDAEVFQAAFDEADDFVSASFRLNEFGILAIEIEQRFLESGKFEEIVFFGDGFQRTIAIRAEIAGIGLGDEGVVVNAVEAGVMAFINVAVLAALAEEPLDGAHVLEIGGADKFVGRNAEFVPESAPSV